MNREEHEVKERLEAVFSILSDTLNSTQDLITLVREQERRIKELETKLPSYGSRI